MSMLVRSLNKGTNNFALRYASCYMKSMELYFQDHDAVQQSSAITTILNQALVGNHVLMNTMKIYVYSYEDESNQ